MIEDNSKVLKVAVFEAQAIAARLWHSSEAVRVHDRVIRTSLPA